MKLVKRILKIMGIIFGTLVVFIIGFYVKAHIATEERISRKYTIEIEDIDIKADSALIAEGYRLTSIKGCRDCHDNDMGGKMFIDDPLMGTLPAPNITKGNGGLDPHFNSKDWVRVLKHGLDDDSTSLWVMPSHKFTKLTEHDMRAIIAYCSQLPDIDRNFDEPKLGPLARVLTDVGEIPLLPAEYIDHKEPLIREIEPEISISYGKYLATSCTGCHQENLKGGKQLSPGQPIPPDISSTGHVGKWSDEQFMATLRTGTTPEGKELDSKYMPWPMTKSYTDVELKALKIYLSSL